MSQKRKQLPSWTHCLACSSTSLGSVAPLPSRRQKIRLEDAALWLRRLHDENVELPAPCRVTDGLQGAACADRARMIGCGPSMPVHGLQCFENSTRMPQQFTKPKISRESFSSSKNWVTTGIIMIIVTLQRTLRCERQIEMWNECNKLNKTFTLIDKTGNEVTYSSFMDTTRVAVQEVLENKRRGTCFSFCSRLHNYFIK